MACATFTTDTKGSSVGIQKPKKAVPLHDQCRVPNCVRRALIGTGTCKYCDPAIDFEKRLDGMCVMRDCAKPLPENYQTNRWFCVDCAAYRADKQYVRFRVRERSDRRRELHKAQQAKRNVSTTKRDGSATTDMRIFMARDSCSAHTLQHASPERAAAMINRILNGRMSFVGTA